MRRTTTWAALAAGTVMAAFSATELVGIRPATADAAPADSPYAGTYTGEIRYGGGCQENCFKPYWILDVTISSTGRITGVANWFENVFWGVYQSPAGDGSATGSIAADGTLRFTAKEGKRSAKFSGPITTGASGEIYCTGSSGGNTIYLALIPQ